MTNETAYHIRCMHALLLIRNVTIRIPPSSSLPSDLLQLPSLSPSTLMLTTSHSIYMVI